MQQANAYEQLSLLGYLLTNYDEPKADKILQRVAPEYFPNREYSEIYRAIRNRYKNGSGVDVLDVLTDVSESFKESDLSLIRATLKEAMLDATAPERSEITANKLIECYLWEQARKGLETAENADEMTATLYDFDEELQRLRAEQEAKRPENIAEYLNRAFQNDLDEFQATSKTSTGFDNLDEETGGLYSGLYVLGAISSLGKTTFIHQMADNIASSGTDVLYFSLEQSTAELVTKSIAREAAKAEMLSGATLSDLDENCKPAIYYRNCGIKTEQGKTALSNYSENTAPHMHIIEGNFHTNVDYIRSYVSRFIRGSESKRAVVVIDYLQILQSESQSFGKENVDRNITELKRMSRDYNIPVIVISSFNRGNYMTPVSFESFKESGGIEYTADVVWGLQLQALNDELFEKEGKIKAKRDKLKEAKEEIPRKIQLVCLKNRFGKTSFDLAFHYNPKFDLFLAATPIMKAHEAGATSLSSVRKAKTKKKTEELI